MSSGETPLSTYGGNGVPRSQLKDGIVLRTAGLWSQSVVELLKHLEHVGFSGAPRAIGDGFATDGREAITFVPGQSAHPHAWSDDRVTAIGELLRHVHLATVDFEPPPNAVWKQWFGRDLPGEHPVIGHCDTGPWNIVAHGSSVTLIDWEFAGPVDAMWELAQTAWLNAQLHDDDIAERMGLPPTAARAKQLRLLLDGYGLPKARRTRLVEQMIEFAVLDARQEARLHRVHPDSQDAIDPDGNPVMWGITWRTRSAGWMIEHRPVLERAVS